MVDTVYTPPPPPPPPLTPLQEVIWAMESLEMQVRRQNDRQTHLENRLNILEHRTFMMRMDSQIASLENRMPSIEKPLESMETLTQEPVAAAPAAEAFASSVPMMGSVTYVSESDDDNVPDLVVDDDDNVPDLALEAVELFSFGGFKAIELFSGTGNLSGALDHRGIRSVVTPLQKVLQMLSDLQAKGKEGKHQEEIKFAEFSQFCTSTRESTQSISPAADQRPEKPRVEIPKIPMDQLPLDVLHVALLGGWNDEDSTDKEQFAGDPGAPRCMRCGAPGATGKLVMLCAVCEGELTAADEAPDAVEIRQLLDGYWATKEQQITGELQELETLTTEQITGELQAKDQILREVQALQTATEPKEQILSEIQALRTATELKEQIASEIQAPDDAFFQAGRRERHYRKLARDWYRDVARDLDISEEDSMSDDTPLSCTTPPDQGDSDDLLYSEFPGFKDKKQDMKLDLGDEDNPGKGKGKRRVSIADLTRPAGEWQFYELVDIPGKGKGKRRVSKAAAPLPAAATPPPAAAVPLPAAATPPPAAIAKYESDAESLATEIAQRAINIFNSRIQGMAGLPKVENLRHKLQDQRSALEKAEMGLMD